MEKKPNYALIFTIVTVFIDLLGFSIVLPILAPLLALPYQSTILPNTPYDQRLIIFGFLIGSYAIAQFIATPIIGQLSDHYGRKPLLAISLIGTLIGRLLFILGIVNKDITLLFASRIIDGFTGGNISVAQSALADISTKENRTKNFGLIGAAFGLGFIIGPYLGGKFAEYEVVQFFAKYFPSWIASASTLPLWIASIFCAINIVLFISLFPETIKEKINKPLNFGTSVMNVVKAFKLSNMRIIFGTIFLFTLGFTFFTQYLSVYIGTKFEGEIKEMVQQKIDKGEIIITYPEKIEQITIPQVKAAAESEYNKAYFDGLVDAQAQKVTSDVFSYVGIWIVIAQGFLVRKLAKKFKPNFLLKWGLFVMAGTTLILLLPNELKWLYFIMPIFALANGLTQPNSTALVSTSADAKSQGEILGINTSLAALAQGIPPIINGFITSVDMKLPILVGSGVIFLSFLVFSIFYKSKVHEVVHEE